MNELGNLLKSLRGKRSLRDVADETGLSHSYISDVEKGFRRGTKTPLKPSPDTLKRLSKAYDYSYRDLMEKAGYIEDGADLNQLHSEESFFYFDEENVTPEELEELKKHLQYLRWKAQQENEK